MVHQWDAIKQNVINKDIFIYTYIKMYMYIYIYKDDINILIAMEIFKIN